MQNPSPFPWLLGDIGGTHIRLARMADVNAPLTQVAALRCADFAGPGEAIRLYLDTHAGPAPLSAGFGVAGPVLGDAVRIVNNHWQFSRSALQAALGLHTLRVANDFRVLALGLPALGEAGRRQVGGGTAVPGQPIALIGPGTGLGVSGLLPHGAGYVPLEGEGGHATLAAHTDEEAAVLSRLRAQFAHVSAERVISGPGLPLLHAALAAVRSQPHDTLDASAITARAIDGSDALCVATLEMFCALLGTCASNLALTLGAHGGVYLGGGIVPRLGAWFDRSPFRARFEDKGRYRDYLSAIPVWVITAPDVALHGAAQLLRDSPQS